MEERQNQRNRLEKAIGYVPLVAMAGMLGTMIYQRITKNPMNPDTFVTTCTALIAVATGTAHYT